MRSAIRDLCLVVCAYLLVWGVSWTTGGHSGPHVFGITDSGTSYSFQPAVFLGGLPPAPSPASDLPQLLAAIVGGVGLTALVARGARPMRST
jgi:hypothetical protein